jgi:hypothetical protein
LKVSHIGKITLANLHIESAHASMKKYKSFVPMY